MTFQNKNQLENVYIRGSKIRFLILPDMLKNSVRTKVLQITTEKTKIRQSIHVIFY